MTIAATPQDHPAAVAIEGVSCSYGSVRVLHALDLDVAPGEVLALLGPSGCGKTTLLRLIAGLLTPDTGTIRIAGQTVAEPAAHRFLPPERRMLGMVFQDYALWPHLTVIENVVFPLEMRGVRPAERKRRAMAALARVGLADFAARFPAALSGGQQQRVSIARAMVAEPRVVLFDEPLSNLDKELRDNLAAEISELVRGLGLTAVYVTHDQAEAFALADRVAVMRDGRIMQLASPEEIVGNPARPEVADFLHLGTLAPARRSNGHLELLDGAFRLPASGIAAAPDACGHLLLPRRALAIAPREAADMEGEVVRTVFRGDHHMLTVRLGAPPRTVEVHVSAPRRGAVGEVVGLSIEHESLRFYPGPTGPALTNGVQA